MPEKLEVDDKTIQEIFDKSKENSINQGKEEIVDPEADLLAAAARGETPPSKEAAVDAKAKVDDFLTDHGYENLEELGEALERSSTLEGKLGEKDLDAIIEAASTLDKYREHWAQEEALKLESSEESEDTVARLKNEVAALKRQKQIDDEADAKLVESKKAVTQYESEVTSSLEKDGSIPKELIPFYEEFLGVNNPVLDVNLDDKVAVKRVIKEQTERMNTFVKSIIKAYNEKKVGTLDIAPTNNTAPETKNFKDTVKNLSDSRKLASGVLAKLLNRKE